MAAILADDIFKRIFLNENVRIFISNFTEICSWGSNWQLVSIGSGNGLAPNRWQAITWSNDDPVYRRIYAALGGWGGGGWGGGGGGWGGGGGGWGGGEWGELTAFNVFQQFREFYS